MEGIKKLSPVGDKLTSGFSVSSLLALLVLAPSCTKWFWKIRTHHISACVWKRTFEDRIELCNICLQIRHLIFESLYLTFSYYKVIYQVLFYMIKYWLEKTHSLKDSDNNSFSIVREVSNWTGKNRRQRKLIQTVAIPGASAS